jgi:phosphoribosyl 1,2-cyclic phosphodiesterase
MGIRLTVLGSGSAGNATCIEADGARVLVDAGFSCRELAGRLRAVGVEPDRIDGLLITHEHSDHVRGAARFSRTFGVPVYCTAATFSAAGLDQDGVHAHAEVGAGRPFAVGALSIHPFPVPHDAADTLGFVLACGGRRIGYATDLGHGAAPVREALRDCDLLILESNHDVEMLRSGPYPEIIKQRVLGRHGHLDNEAAAAILEEVAGERTRRVVLAHLSRTNNRPDLALRAARATFDRAGRHAPAIHPAGQWSPTPWFEA